MGGTDRLVLGVRLHRNLPRVLCRGSTRLAHPTGITRGLGKPDAHDRMPLLTVSWSPLDTAVPLGTARLLSVPVDQEGVHIKTLAFSFLPT
jgi:hypothetical protein